MRVEASSMELLLLYKRPHRNPSSLSPCEVVRVKNGDLGSGFSPDAESACTMILVFPGSRIARN